MPFIVDRMSVRWSIVLGCLALTASLALYVVQGFFLMDFDDRNDGDWSWAQANIWLASLPTGLRVTLWVTAIAAPTTLALGTALIAVGLFLIWRRRAAQQRIAADAPKAARR